MAIVNALLVRWSAGYTWVEDAGSIATWKRREAYLSVAATSEPEAVRIATAILVDRAAPLVGTQATLEPTGSDEPYVDFEVGDWITAPDLSGTPASQRVVSLTVTEDDEGNPVFVPELGSVQQERERANQRWLKRMANGALAGTVESAMPAQQPVPERRKPPTAPIGPFSIPGSVIVATSGRYYPPRNVLALRMIASLAVAGSSDTTVQLMRNDVVIATATLAAGEVYVEETVNVTFGITDYATVQTTAAGTDATGLVVQVPTV